MELREIKPTAEVEFETESGALRFTVGYRAGDQLALDYQGRARLSDRIRAGVADAIVDWNLAHDDGAPWPCDEKTKVLLLPQLVNIPVKQKLDADGRELVPEGVLLGLALFRFIQDPGNFLKN
jgi:hypothetical protein